MLRLTSVKPPFEAPRFVGSFQRKQEHFHFWSFAIFETSPLTINQRPFPDWHIHVQNIGRASLLQENAQPNKQTLCNRVRRKPMAKKSIKLASRGDKYLKQKPTCQHPGPNLPAFLHIQTPKYCPTSSCWGVLDHGQLRFWVRSG